MMDTKTRAERYIFLVILTALTACCKYQKSFTFKYPKAEDYIPCPQPELIGQTCLRDRK